MISRYVLILTMMFAFVSGAVAEDEGSTPRQTIPIHLMHLVYPPYGTRFPYFQGEFISELVNNRSDILPDYEYKLSYGVTAGSVCIYCVVVKV